VKKTLLAYCLMITACSAQTSPPQASNLKFQVGDRARVVTDAFLGATRWEVQTDAIRFKPEGTHIRGTDRTGRDTKPNLIALQPGTPVRILYRSRTNEELGDLRPYFPHYSRLDGFVGVPKQHVEVDSTVCVRVLDGPHRDVVGFVLAAPIEKLPPVKPDPLEANSKEIQSDLKVGDTLALSGRSSLFFTYLNRPVVDLRSIRRRHVIVRPDPAQDELSEECELVAIFEMADGSILRLGEIMTDIPPAQVADNPFRIVDGEGGVYRVKNEGNPIELFNLYLFKFKEPVGTIAGPHVVNPKRAGDQGKADPPR